MVFCWMVAALPGNLPRHYPDTLVDFEAGKLISCQSTSLPFVSGACTRAKENAEGGNVHRAH